MHSTLLEAVNGGRTAQPCEPFHAHVNAWLQAVVDVLRNRVSHPMTRALGLSVLNQVGD